MFFEKTMFWIINDYKLQIYVIPAKAGIQK